MVSDKKCLFGGVAVAAWGRHRLEIGEVGWGLVENLVKEGTCFDGEPELQFDVTVCWWGRMGCNCNG